jgi:putative flippase GtrA
MSKKFIKNYIIIGCINTAFSYTVSVAAYKIFLDKVNFILISITLNIVLIFVSYINMKIFVFKTKKNWINEITKAYTSYFLIGCLGSALFYLLNKKMNIEIMSSQFITTITIISLSYHLNKKFTFKEVDKKIE